MKTIIFSIALALVSLAGMAQNGSMKVSFVFKNVEEGYDHNCKTEVYVDGTKVGTSPEVSETKGATFTVSVPTGKHDLRVINYAQYEGNWEEHLIENNYSIDCLVEEGDVTFKKKMKLYIVFDVDQGTLYNWGKPVKVKKEK